MIGRFDLYCAMRRMNKNQNVKFKNQELPDELARRQWERFDRKFPEGVELVSEIRKTASGKPDRNYYRTRE